MQIVLLFCRPSRRTQAHFAQPTAGILQPTLYRRAKINLPLASIFKSFLSSRGGVVKIEQKLILS